jgi:hypothetical protein
MRHDFSHSQDTKTTLPEHDRMQLDPQDILTDNDENDIALLCPSDTLLNILRHVLLCARDMCLVIWHRIIEFWHVEYELQRTIVNAGSLLGRYLLIFIVQQVVVFFMTHLTEHFSEYLSGMTICYVLIILLGVLFPLRLCLLRRFEKKFTSTDRIT